MAINIKKIASWSGDNQFDHVVGEIRLSGNYPRPLDGPEGEILPKLSGSADTIFFSASGVSPGASNYVSVHPETGRLIMRSFAGTGFPDHFDPLPYPDDVTGTEDVPQMVYSFYAVCKKR